MSDNVQLLPTEKGYLEAGQPNFFRQFIGLTKKKWGKAAIKSKYLTIALRGDNVACPCCNKTFVTFLPAGLVRRANAKCPNCNSLERHRIVWLFLKNKTDFFKKKLRVMNVTPEPLFYKKFSSLPNIEYVAVDKYPELYGYGNQTIRMDITDITFPNNSFDVIICNHVLEHVQEDVKAMQEMHRVLKPGGFAILNSPVDHKRGATFEDHSVVDPQRRLELFGQPDHVRVYGIDYTDRLKEAGFKVEVIDYAASFSANERFKFGMQDGEEIYLCTKN